MTNLLSQLAPAGQLVLNAVLPARCIACGVTVEGAGALCPRCWGGIRFLADPACECCGYPFEYAVPERTRCAACIRRQPAFDRARAAFAYDDASKGMILAFKHADRTQDALPFGRWLHRAGAALMAEADLITPVPLHRWRLFNRRYNQAGLLAQALGRETGKQVATDTLVRHRRTQSQGRLSRSARIRNIRGAIGLRGGAGAAVNGARVLMIDDVFTTGATVEECARVLKRAGARRVDVLTLARVVRPQN